MNIVLSIKPKYISEIQSGRKKFEFRKAIFKQPVKKVYIYASAPISKIVGEFQPRIVLQGKPSVVWKQTKNYAGIEKKWYDNYYYGHEIAYALKIQKLIVYKTPKEIPFRAPQSFRYIETL